MVQKFIDTVVQAAMQSELLRAVRAVALDFGRSFVLGDSSLRPLTGNEITELERGGNQAEDWALVHVADGFDPRRVRHCSFHGTVLLGRFIGTARVEAGLELPTGVYNSTLADCVIGPEVLVKDVKLLARYVVRHCAVLWNCGNIACTCRTTFGNGQSLPLGIESGGRNVPIYAEITVPVATMQAVGSSRCATQQRYDSIITDYLVQAESDRGIIERGAIVRNTPTIQNTYVGPHAVIDGATRVQDCTLLSNIQEPSQIRAGAVVRNSVLQWGARVTDLAVVERSVLTEHSEVECQAHVVDTLLGPDTSIGTGEVAASLVGPLVRLHHQSLLIAALWPDGRGNIGQGADVGANHTSRAPDQECWLPEGIFLGLGVKLKYPVNLTRSPYSIIASGVTLCSQRVAFPYSLIRTPTEHWSGVSPEANQVVPGWVLAHNLYALQRNLAKFRVRHRARRQRIDIVLFTPKRIDLMRDACARLQSVGRIQDLYTSREVPGLGKNVLEESHRRQAMLTYQFFIRYYALEGMKEQAQKWLTNRQEPIDRLLSTPTTDPRWEHQRQLLAGELEVREVAAGLREFSTMAERIALDVERSRRKDEERGREVLDDYTEVHGSVAQDPFVQQTWAEARQQQQLVEQLLSRLERASATAILAAGPSNHRPMPQVWEKSKMESSRNGTHPPAS
jgi:hypothetical protein